MSTRPARGRSDDGTATLELVIVTPFLLALVMLIFAFARYAQTENLVDQAARDAARAATAQNVRSQARPTADRVLREAMQDAPSSCRDSARVIALRMTPRAFELPDPNDPTALDSVTVTVQCTLDLSDLTALPLKSVTIERTFTSPLDRYRGYR